jgi:hypothetical protein
MYRIKIEERNNGEKRYMPQKGYLHISGGWIKRQEIRWDNLFCGSFSSESLALEKIEEYKKLVEKRKSEEVKSTTYKMID